MGYGFCVDVNGLMSALNIRYDPIEWRLFIAGSVSGLKAVLLHNRNKINSILLAFANNTPENYDTMEKILAEIKYGDHKWKI